MKRYLISLLAAIALPTAIKAEVDPNIHKLCLPATDYVGCIKFQTNNEDSQVIQNESLTNELVTGQWKYRAYEGCR